MLHPLVSGSNVTGHRTAGFRGVADWCLGATVFWTVACVWCAVAARAADGWRIDLPLNRTRPKHGLQLQIESQWVNGNGYVPIRVQVSSVRGPVSADRHLDVELQLCNWNLFGPTVSQSIVLPQKSTQVDATVSIPCWGTSTELRVRVYEEGRLLDELSPRKAVSVQSNYYAWSEARPAILCIDSDAPSHSVRMQLVGQGRSRRPNSNGSQASYVLPDLRVIDTLCGIDSPGVTVNLPGQPGTGSSAGTNPTRATDMEILLLVDGQPKLDLLPPAELPTSWRDWTCLDLVFVSYDDLVSMAQLYPDQLAALRAWLATGPTLCVYGVTNGDQRLHELDKLLGLAPESVPESGQVSPWRTPLSDDASENLNVFMSFSMPVQFSVPAPAPGVRAPDPGAPQPALSTASENDSDFVWRYANLGRVVALRAGDPFPGTGEFWGRLVSTVEPASLRWYQRHGVSLSRPNRDYWNLLIPGVGMPPVATFLVLITAFVVIIGPVNYLLLQRYRRLYLLLVTVPLGAAAVTLGLLGYALVVDGLGASVRIRSFTQIDQRTGRSVGWSRQSYYAALAPSNGLEFPLDAAVYPILPQPNRENGRGVNARRLRWGETQQLSGGYLRSRTLAQYLVIQSGLSDKRLDFSGTGSTDDAHRVTNHLGADIQQLLVADDAGRLYWGASIPAGGVLELTPIDAEKARKRLAATFSECRPQTPEDIDPSRYNTAWTMGARYYWGSTDNGFPEAATSASVLERRLGELSQSLGHLEPRTYVAVAQAAPMVPVGLTTVRREACLEVIVGSW